VAAVVKGLCFLILCYIFYMLILISLVAIGERGKRNIHLVPHQIPQPMTTPTKKSAKEWTDTGIQNINKKQKGARQLICADMLEWMKANGIEAHYTAFKKHKFDGKSLNEVRTILLTPQSNISSFLEFLFDRLGISDLGDMFRIIAALRNLPQ
jgi:hypothetical protein